MWPSPGRNNNGISSSSTRSKSSTSSCLSPSSPGTPVKRSMEEVWKDITLITSLQDHDATDGTTNNTTNNNPNTTNTSATAAATLIFQDFFATPFNNKDPPPPPTAEAAASANPGPLSKESCIGPLPQHHGALLSLNSGSSFNFLENIISPGDHQQQQRPSQQMLQQGYPLNNSPFDMELGPAQVVPSVCLKRPEDNGDYSSSRRYKRMMKNRESAARSRARKQAYTTELEQEVSHLEKENAKLRRQLEQVLAASGQQLTKKHTLSRTSTAPF